MKKIIISIFILLFTTNFCLAASGTGGKDRSTEIKRAEKLIKRAKTFEKDNFKKAEKFYMKANKILKELYKMNKKDADILNYLGFTLRKTGDLQNAEIYYLQGLELDPNHLGINEYLGELYIQTNRIELAKERLAILKNCNCEEYEELYELIKNY